MIIYFVLFGEKVLSLKDLSISLAAAARLRNLIVHWYWAIDDRKLYESVVKGLGTSRNMLGASATLSRGVDVTSKVRYFRMSKHEKEEVVERIRELLSKEENTVFAYLTGALSGETSLGT